MIQRASLAIASLTAGTLKNRATRTAAYPNSARTANPAQIIRAK